ncbi:protein phosphatase CheZ [Flexibacterium corallicola]|uniref:protein phosphatase CheZ n=1 Tax=Flexibacterium corallicola TaxID=3037259 RepID=UPI00286F574C|nr:protein phosphatase CheZ [Pseudovibrio sp. M1P-2-3]
MAIVENLDVKSVIEFLEENKTRTTEITLNDVMRLAEVMAGSMTDAVIQVQPNFTEELMAIGAEIARMKSEIAKLRVAEMKSNRIPEAGRELDAIVSATEEATNSIMEAAEAIMAADPEESEAYVDTVNAQVMEIFQACAFQDITGQRISRVVRTLNFIDERVSTFIEHLRLSQEVNASDEVEESEEEKRARELILHGPQHVGEGVSQGDIDALMGSSDQADIDKLFG